MLDSLATDLTEDTRMTLWIATPTTTKTATAVPTTTQPTDCRHNAALQAAELQRLGLTD